MAREITISFALTAALSSGFKGAFQSASSAARNVSAAVRQMERTPVGNLGAAMTQQREKIKSLAVSVSEAKSTLVTLQNQAQATGGGTAMLARQVELAQTRVNNLYGAMQRQLGLWRNTYAQAATTGGSVRNLCQEYDRLSQKMERLKKTQIAMNANRAQADALRAQRADLNSRLTGAVAAAATIAIPAKLSIDFEQSIANVGAVANASDEDMQRLTDTARQLGRDTMFSASQAAEGMKYLAMAGFNTEQTIAAMPGMLDLAAASNTDLGTTADIASDILTAFGMKASEMGEVGNILTRAFTSSNTDLSMLGETMKYVAPVAASLGMTLDQTAAYAGAMANAGIKASQGGTVLRAAMLRLAAPPKASRDTLGKLTGLEGDELEKLQEELDAGAEQLAQLGMSTKDSAGNMRPLVDILEELNVRTKDMGNAEKAAVFKNIFGTEASAGMINLAAQADQIYEDTGELIVDKFGNTTSKLRKMLETTTNQEISASKVAKKQMDTTHGSLLLLSSAWQEVGISVGNLFLPAIQAAAGAFSTIANVISATVNRFPLLSKTIALTVGGIVSLIAASVGVGLVMNFVRTGLNGFRGGLLRLSATHLATTASTIATTTATSGFGIASRMAGAGARFFAGGLRSILVATGVGAALVGMGLAVNMLIDNWDTVVVAMSTAWNWVQDTWGRLGVFFTTLGDNLATIFSGWSQTLSEKLGPIWNVLSSFYTGLFGGIINIAKYVWSNIFNLIVSPVETIKSVWSDLTGAFSWIWSRIEEYASWLWNGVCSIASWAYDTVSGIWTGAVEMFQDITQGISSAFIWAHDGIVGIWQGITGFFDSIGLGVFGSFAGMWQNVTDMAAWAWENIAGIWTGVTDFFAGIVDSIFGVFGGLFDWLQEKFSWVFSTIDAVGSVIGSITGAVSNAWNAAFGEGDKKTSAPAANGEKATGAARQAIDTPVVQKPTAAPQAQAASNPSKRAPMLGTDWKPGAPVSPQKAGKAGSGSGRKKSGGSGGGSRGGSHTGAGSGSDSGPVTVVSLDSGNVITTQFVAAGSPNAAQLANSTKPSPISGSGFATNAAYSQPARPVTPSLLAKSRAEKSKEAQGKQQGISIDLTQNFDLITQDAAAARKVLETIKPDMEALIRRALEKISSDKRRTAYAQ